MQQRKNLPQGPRPPVSDPAAGEEDLYPMPTLKEYLSAKPVQYKPTTKAQHISDFFQTMFWIGLALTVLYAGDGENSLISILLTDDESINRDMLTICLYSLGVATAIFLYVTVYLQWFKGLPSAEFVSEAPWSIPLATVCGFSSLITFTIAIWGRFRFWSILITPALFMGFLFTLVLHDMLMSLVCLPLNMGRGNKQGAQGQKQKGKAAGGKVSNQDSD